MHEAGPHIEVGTGSSVAADAAAAGAEAARAAAATIRHHRPSIVLVYASSRYDAGRVLAGVHTVFSGVPVCGVTTAGEVCNTRTTGSVVVAALASPHLAVHCAVGRRVSAGAEAALSEAIDAPAIRPFFTDSVALRQRLTREGKSLFAVLFSPGNTKAHDARGYELTELLKARSLGALPIFGGAAADDWRLEENAVLLGREACPDSLLVAVFETGLQVGIAMAHGFRPTGRATTVTEAGGQEMLSLDGQPAAEIVPRLFESTREALAGRHATLTTGKAVGIRDAMGQYGLTVCTFPTERDGVRVPQPLAPGTVLNVMEPDPSAMADAGAKAIRKARLRGTITEPAIALVNYCALRARLVGDERAAREIEAMTAVTSGAPLVGFCSFGEAGLGDDGISRYANASVSVLVIGKELSEVARVALEAEHLRAELQTKADELEHQVEIRTRQLAQQAEELAATAEKLGAVSAAKSLFLANMSHELRTPLNAVLGFSEIIQDARMGPLAAKYREYGRDIHQAGSYLLHLINDVLDAAKMEAGQLVLQEEAFDLAALIVECRRLIADKAGAGRVEVLTDSPPGLPPFFGDRLRLKQILLNLLSNAVKFTPAGGTVRVSVVWPAQDGLVIAVADTGIGMRPDQVPLALEPFRQLEETLVRRYEGSGLGLPLANGFAEKHGGRLTIETSPGAGTTVCVWLPASRVLVRERGAGGQAGRGD